jgi:hypothetical protein
MVIEKHVADKLQHNNEFKYDKIDIVVRGDGRVHSELG